MQTHNETFIPAPERLTNRDGCDCPPWVLRCAHFEGKQVVLADNVGLSPLCHGVGPRFLVSKPFSGSADKVCPSCGGRFYGRLTFAHLLAAETLAMQSKSPYSGGDYAAALTAFYEAEERLLRGEL